MKILTAKIVIKQVQTAQKACMSVFIVNVHLKYNKGCSSNVTDEFWGWLPEQQT